MRTKTREAGEIERKILRKCGVADNAKLVVSAMKEDRVKCVEAIAQHMHFAKIQDTEPLILTGVFRISYWGFYYN